jgi:[ribosomal protein S5]-alanine N-acetyltransferase
MHQTVSHNDFPSLETERLLLRQLLIEDVDFIFRHFSNSDVTQYLMDEPPVSEYTQARDIIQFYQEPEVNARNRWGIIHKSDNELIGTCGFHKWEKQYFRSELGYDLNPKYWGQGYMKEALRAVIQNGFYQMGLNRIDALVYIKNVRSIRLLQKLGFTKEGTLRDYFYLDGKYYDHFIFALLRKEWKGLE